MNVVCMSICYKYSFVAVYKDVSEKSFSIIITDV